jgi:hypothetical protein
VCAPVALLALVATACHGAPDLIGPKAVRIHGPIHTNGTAIVDVTGRTVRFNGVGVRDFVEVGAPGSGCVTAPPQDEAKNIADWGFNAVRIPLAWANLEPAAPTQAADGSLVHTWDATYLAYLDGFIHDLTSRGVAVVLTIHNKFGSNVEKGRCNLSSVPDWMYPGGRPDGAQARCDFLQGVTASGAPESIWDGYAAVWSMLVTRYANDPQVVAVDMVNEPYPAEPCSAADLKLADLYGVVGTAVRGANPAMALVFEDGPPRLAVTGTFELTDPPPFPNVIYSYHLYQPNWIPVGKSVNDTYWERAQGWGVPLLVGEFNAFGYAAPGGDYDPAWARDTLQALQYFRQTGISWMAWAYSGGNHLVEKDGTPRADIISTFQKGY